MVRVERTLQAPEGWAVSSAWVPPGSEVALRVRMEAVVDGVLVTGTAAVQVVSECSRCLDEVWLSQVSEIQQLYEYPDIQSQLPVEALEQDPLPTMEGDLLDLEPAVRDAVVLDLPLVPLCSESCPGLCPACGARLADDPDHEHGTADPRWAALSDWLQAPAARTDEARPEMKGY